MCKIFGYGEDALTFWALNDHLSEILEALKDQTAPSDCLVFFRPSFGRRGGSETAGFGEFDAILVASKNVYLVESKWDGFQRWDPRARILLGKEQKLRHQVFLWYLLHWNPKYSGDWKSFVRDHNAEFQNQFDKKLARASKLLAENLEMILTRINEHCNKLKPENVKNVIVFFYNKERKSSPPSRVPENFSLVSLDYSHVIEGNFVVLEKCVRSC
jgi:hypothetical protein